MEQFIQKFKNIKNQIHVLNSKVTLVAVTKGKDINTIKPIIDLGHKDFGENKVQEAMLKWHDILKVNDNINLHLLGKLQSNKAEQAFRFFNFIHSLDNEKLAKIFSDLEKNSSRKIKYFIQVNIGDEIQKHGINVQLLPEFINLCKKDLKLNILGLMCIPPVNESPIFYFKKLKELALKNNVEELSMGMSNDYIHAIECGSTFVRIGSSIFGPRSN
jgi:pyridoxal phosphate enzyme (YggS family)